MKAISTDLLTKYYSGGKIKALQDFTIEIEQGQIFSLLGPNGAGKTTLIKLLLGIVKPTRGEGYILGKPIRHYLTHQKIGYLPENHRFPDFLTPKQILNYYGRMSGLTTAEINDRTPGLIKMVNLEKWLDIKVRKFSKGMLQRLGLAQALINDPEILFLDEPTDGIDPVGRREIRDILKQLSTEGKTVFLNSHLLSEVERMSDQIAILKDGILVEQGDLEKFISVHRQYQIKMDENPASLEEACRALNLSIISSNGEFTVTADDNHQLNQLIDHIRSRQGVIVSIIPRKISLEDFFIQVVHENGAKHE